MASDHESKEQFEAAMEEHAKPTPTPWEASGTLVTAPPRSLNIEDQIGVTFKRICVTDNETYMTPEEADANAAFIVRAVNNFDALLAACKAVVEWADDNPGESGFTAVDLVRAAITAAKEGA